MTTATASDWTSPNGSARVLLGDVRQRLAELPAGSVQAVVTSPPYWALRDYGVAWQIGSEKTPEEYLATMVDVFRGVRRVLRDDGTLWVNMGDSYDAGTASKRRPSKTADHGGWTCPESVHRTTAGLAPGNQLLMPHRLALAMQADSWTLRSTIVWAKKSPMPESLAGWRWVRCRVKVEASKIPTWSRPDVSETKEDSDGYTYQEKLAKWTSCPGCPKCTPNGGYVLRRGAWRCTNSFEYVFMFTKGMRYFADGEACKEPTGTNTHGRGKGTTPKGAGGVAGRERANNDFQAEVRHVLANHNPRSVWSLSTEPFKGAHFATFPGMLVYRCLLAATSKAGCCPACGAAWAPVVSIERVATQPGLANKIWKHSDGNHVGQRSQHSPHLDPQRHVTSTAVSGYRPTCTCDAGPSIPMTVMDPFSGSGSTGQVCQHMGLCYVGIELSPEYLEMSKTRILTPWKPRHERKPSAKRKKRQWAQLELWSERG